MKLVVQRVSSASVSVKGKEIAHIQQGLLVLVGIFPQDNEATVAKIVHKLTSLRLFADKHRDINRSVVDIGGEILLVSQFTLCARTDKGNRPSFIDSASPEHANKIYQLMKKSISKIVPVQTGQFGAYMQVKLINDGPATIILEA